MNTVEFTLRENNTGNFPRGLALMLRALTTWLYDGDPLALIAFESPLETVKSRLISGASYFEEMIDRFFVDNPHRTTLIMKPDPTLEEEEKAAESERLGKIRASMSLEEIREAVKTTGQLRKIQEAPDPPEALATIPTLKIEDLDRKNKAIPVSSLDERGTKILYHDLFTNGIVYLDLGFNLHVLPQKYLPYARLFGRALLEMGTDEEDFVTLTQRISRKTGGIRLAFHTSVAKDTESGSARLFLRGKAMMRQTQEMLNILKDILLTVRLDNRERFRQMVLEEKARLEQKLVPGGHQMVNLRLRAHFNEADWAAEQMGGLTCLFFLRQLARDVGEDWGSVLADLEEMRRILVNRNAMILNITLDDEGWVQFRTQVIEFLHALPAEPAALEKWSPEKITDFEGMTIPSKVNYVGKGDSLYQMGYRFHGSANVITRYLRTAWLWERIRVQGGAYGAICLFDRLSGVLTFVSYRDPNLVKTIESFDQSGRYLSNIQLSDEELKKSIIGSIGDMDRYRLPDAKGYTSMVHYLTGETDEDRQKMRDEVLSTTAADFRDFGRVLETVADRGLVKVLGAQSAIQEALSERPGWLNMLKVL
jgi:Zn-dependent M16 (insulinase) family peptidase